MTSRNQKNAGRPSIRRSPDRIAVGIMLLSMDSPTVRGTQGIWSFTIQVIGEIRLTQCSADEEEDLRGRPYCLTFRPTKHTAYQVTVGNGADRETVFYAETASEGALDVRVFKRGDWEKKIGELTDRYIAAWMSRNEPYRTKLGVS